MSGSVPSRKSRGVICDYNKLSGAEIRWALDEVLLASCDHGYAYALMSLAKRTGRTVTAVRVFFDSKIFDDYVDASGRRYYERYCNEKSSLDPTRKLTDYDRGMLNRIHNKGRLTLEEASVLVAMDESIVRQLSQNRGWVKWGTSPKVEEWKREKARKAKKQGQGLRSSYGG